MTDAERSQVAKLLFDPKLEQPGRGPRLDAVDCREIEDVGRRQPAAMYLISVDAKTEAVQPRNLGEVRVERHVKKAFIGRALLNTTYRIDPGIGEIAELQIVTEIVQRFLKLSEWRNT